MRNNYDTIEQLELHQAAHRKQLTREEMIRLLDEYRDVLFYIIDHELDEESNMDIHKEKLFELVPFSRSMFGEETISKLRMQVIKMKEQAKLGVDIREPSGKDG